MKNKYSKTVYNIGFIGEGNYKITKNNQRTKTSSVWKDMLQRCYKGTNKWDSYKNVTVCEDWHNFQNFAEWFQQNYKEEFELDKDILVKGNKIYSPETCCFVPKEINYLFVKCDKKRGKYPIGVSLVHNKFQVTLRKYGKTYNLGRYSVLEEAFQVYKKAKEGYIKEVADKWKDKIDFCVYKAMYSYQVEITD